MKNNYPNKPFNSDLKRVFLSIVFFILSYSSIHSSDTLNKPKKRVLIIHSYHNGYEWDDSIRLGITSKLNKLSNIELYTEYLDTMRSNSVEHLDLMEKLFLSKYKTYKPDIIICSDDNALNFLNNRPHIFENIDIVFCGINNYEKSRFKNIKRITGVNEEVSIVETVELALQFRPGAKRLITISDSSITFKRNLDIFLQSSSLWSSKIEIVNLNGLEEKELIQRLKNTDKNDILIYLGYLSTPSGKRLSVKDSIQLIKSATNSPVFGMWDFLMPHGIIGGFVVHGFSQGESAADIAVQILNGKNINTIPVTMKSPNKFVFDDSMLEMYEIPDDLLPNGSIILNQKTARFISQWHGKGIKSSFGYDLFDNHSTNMLLIDPDTGLIVDANKAAIKFYGYPRIVGMNISDINTLTQSEIKYEMEKAVNAQKNYFHFRHKLSDDTIKDVAVYSGTVRVEEKNLIFSIVNDITNEISSGKRAIIQRRLITIITLSFLIISILIIILLIFNLKARKKAESENQYRKRILETLLDNLPIGVFMVEAPSGKPLVANQHAKNLLGRGILPDANKENLSEIYEAYKSGTGMNYPIEEMPIVKGMYGISSYIDDMIIVRPDGKTTLVEVFGTPVLKDKKVEASIVSFIDITQRKKAELIIAEKNKELEQIVYVASHDLRSPLVNVDGYSREVEFLIKDIQKLLTEKLPTEVIIDKLNPVLFEMSSALTYIRNSAKQMDSLLKGLLKLSRTGRASLYIENIDMNQLLARTSELSNYQTKEKGIELTIGNLPPCIGDAVQLTQLFSNLIGNAIKYLSPGRPGIIKISGEVKSGNSLYTVEDNGIGIAAEHQQKIFELFHRLNPTETDGDGLGLTIVKQILGRLEGNISVESTPGQGSKFIVSLPYIKPKG